MPELQARLLGESVQASNLSKVSHGRGAIGTRRAQTSAFCLARRLTRGLPSAFCPSLRAGHQADATDGSAGEQANRRPAADTQRR